MANARIDKFSEDELRKLVAESNSIYELSLKLGYTAKGNNTKTIRNRLDKYNISTEHFSGRVSTQVHRDETNVFIENSTASQSTLRRWYIKGNYTPYKCAICGQEPFWNGKELTLTLDHINGVNRDDRLENLRWICPNCDRQLDTFGSKNINKKIAYNADLSEHKCVDCGIPIGRGAERCPVCAHILLRSVERPSKEELYNFLISHEGNFTEAGRTFNVTDNSVRKWCKSYGLPYHSADYKNK